MRQIMRELGLKTFLLTALSCSLILSHFLYSYALLFLKISLNCQMFNLWPEMNKGKISLKLYDDWQLKLHRLREFQ